jgi:serine/threonine-protein kinase
MILNERYRLLGQLARGGMSLIYRAISLSDQSLCAIKISRWSEALQDMRQFESAEALAEEKARIDREWKLLHKAASRSQHIVQVLDSYDEDPRIGLYYPMEFLKGQPLSKMPFWGQAINPREVVELILQLGDGVSVAHGLGVVHRDLNPDNIFIVRTADQQNFVKLIDFGIARDLYARRQIYNTDTDLVFGHLNYLAPEQVGYNPATDKYQREIATNIDHRADIYSIGAIMFQMLSGLPLFKDHTLEELATRNWKRPEHLAIAIQQDLLPTQLQDLLFSCLQPAPDLRLPDIFALNDLLQNCIKDLPEKWEPTKTDSHNLNKFLQNPHDEFAEDSVESFEASHTDSTISYVQAEDIMQSAHSPSIDMSLFSQEFDAAHSQDHVLSNYVEEFELYATQDELEEERWQSLENAPAFFEPEEETERECISDTCECHSQQYIDININDLIGSIGVIEERASTPDLRPPACDVLPQRSPNLEKVIAWSVGKRENDKQKSVGKIEDNSQKSGESLGGVSLKLPSIDSKSHVASSEITARRSRLASLKLAPVDREPQDGTPSEIAARRSRLESLKLAPVVSEIHSETERDKESRLISQQDYRTSQTSDLTEDYPPSLLTQKQPTTNDITSPKIFSALLAYQNNHSSSHRLVWKILLLLLGVSAILVLAWLGYLYWF